MKFRNLTIKSLLLAATTLAGSAAFGQRLIVTSPVSLAGEIDTFTFGSTASGWGAPANFNINAVGILANDGTAAPTLGCTAPWTNAAAVSGKVAIIDRGACNFTVKVANAQSAGAVAALICMATYDPLISPAGSTAQTIPVFMISKTKCNQIKTQLAANVPVNFNLATDINLPNDMRLHPDSIGQMPNWATPLELMRNDFILGAVNRNEGANAQSGVKLTATVSNAGTVYYNENIVGSTSLPSNTNALMVLTAPLDPTGKAGLHTVTYTTSSNSTDDLPSDNVRTTTFKLTDHSYSSGRLDANNKPIGTGYYNAAGNGITSKYEWGFAFKTNDKGDSFVADSVRFGIEVSDATNTTAVVSAAGVVVNTNIYEWDEVAFSSITSSLVAAGQYTCVAGDDGKQLSVGVKDNITLSNPLRLKPNTTYVVTCKVENASVKVWFLADATLNTGTTRSVYRSLADSRSVLGFLDPNTGTLYSGSSTPISMSLDVKKIVLPTVAITANTASTVLTAAPTAGNMGPFTYRWSTTPARTTATITVTAGGTYRVTMTDAVGNAATASYVVTSVAPTVAITANTSGSVLTATTTGGNTPPFRYLWSTSATTSSITITAGGTYIVTVTDGSGSAVTASYSSSLSAENTAANFGLKVFPVPANDYTTVSFDFGKSVEVADMIVTDINGRTVSTTRFNNIQNLNKVLNVSNMAAGQYFITVRTTEGQQTAKFNVVR